MKPRTRKYIKVYEFVIHKKSIQEIVIYCYKNRIGPANTASKKYSIKQIAEAKGELIGNKIAEKKCETKVCT